MKKAEFTMIDRLRKKISRIDAKIIRLLSERMACSRLIKKEKDARRFKITDQNRERKVMTFWADEAQKYDLNKQFTKGLIKSIISESKKIQNEKASYK